MAGKKLVLLDRDGVINSLKHDYVRRVGQFKFVDRAEEAISMLNQHGFSLAVCSNQRGVSRNMVSMETLRSIEGIINSILPANQPMIHYFYCTHSLEKNCACRKPKPGLLLEAITNAGASISETVFVGDNVTDYYAALNAGVEFHLVLTGHGSSCSHLIPDSVNKWFDLKAFAQSICANT